ncbi:transporter substrate-binding domain-containing protein [Pusillimonas sp. SM2304]|uniref:transporter substrate-binding domain-containing protein n=1 Tax=Pusillimonas sp. SM2304 TaxID=3073241 RepID=UPI00287612D4|nr:transporter substrate-binding domain-containing protein [Pusillimonas sp. SM2304]MDS1141356.1 transporter substrate-binding domain-containing protein [Pusillimonas sp. SM2304]
MNATLTRLLALSRRTAIVAAMGLTCSTMLVQASPQPPATAQGGTAGTLQVGMAYVVPPFVDGAKVRTPEAIDTALAEALAGKLGLALQAVPARPAGKDILLGKDKPRATLAVLPDTQSLPASMVAVPTGYAAAPMAIMRTDTDIKSWEQLKGRTVCLSEGGRHVGTLSARYGAQEMVFRAPADALLALRIGECDAAVHDDVMLKALLKLPEWKKFSARLTQAEAAPLVFLASADDTALVGALKQLAKEWKARRHLAALTASRVNDIAFEVYLDQVVADCH